MRVGQHDANTITATLRCHPVWTIALSFPSSFFSYIFFSSLLSVSCHLYKGSPCHYVGLRVRREDWAGWTGLGWAGRAVWWQRRQMMSCAGHWLRLLLVTIYTATLPSSIHVLSGNICTVQSVISISRCLQSSSCLTTWFYRLLFSCPKWTNGSVFVNTISLGVHGESFPFAISVKYFLCFSCCQISIPLD